MITIDLNKAKQIGHELRRQQRAEELAPLDDVIAKQIPGKDLTGVEADRQAIRDRFADVQVAIDKATTPEEIKAALEVQP